MTTPGSALRVMQLNTWNVEGPWVDRLVEITALIRHHRPDVICLQEVVSGPDGRSTAHIIAEQATGAGPHTWDVAFAGSPYPAEVVGIPEGSLWGVAVLSRWPIEDMHARLLSDGWPSMWNVVHARTGGLDVFSVHLTPALHDGVWRERQVREVDAFVREHRIDPVDARKEGGPVLPVVLAGDFNAPPDSAEIRFLTGRQSLEGTSTYYQDAWALAGDGTPGWTWDNDNPFAARLHLHPQRVDYVFVGDHFPFNTPTWPEGVPGTGTGRVVSCELIGRPTLTGTPASDHFGLLAVIAR